MFFFFPPWLRHGRPNQPSPVFSVDLQPHGDRLASAGQDCTVKLWHVPSLSRHAQHCRTKPQQPTSSTATSSVVVPTAEASASNGNDAQQSPPTPPPPGALLATLSVHSAAVNVVRWSPTGKLLASAGDDHVVLIYSRAENAPTSAFAAAAAAGSENWTARRPLRAHSSDVTDLAWSPDSERLASASVDNSIIIWNLRAQSMQMRLDGHHGLVKGVSWDPVGRYIASQSDDRTVRIWRTADWKLDKVLSKPFETAIFPENSMTFFLRIAWSPCGTQLVATNAYRKPGTHHAPLFSRSSDFDVAIEFVGHREPVISTRFSPRLYRPHPNMLKKHPPEEHVKSANGKSGASTPTTAAKLTGNQNAAAQKQTSTAKESATAGDKTNGKESSAKAGSPAAAMQKSSSDATYTVLALGSKDGGCSVWQATRSRPFFEMSNVFDMEVIDLSWGSDGYSLAACSTDGKVLYIRYEPQELGVVVPPEEAREILTGVWRSLGATSEDARPLAESAEQLQMESQKVKNGIDIAAVDKPQQQNPTIVTPSSKPQTSSKPPLPKPTTVPTPGASNNLNAPPITSNSPTPRDTPMEDRDSSVPEPVRAAAEAARQNGPTPPADPKMMAAQAETRVRGGKRRIVPVSVTSDPSATHPEINSERQTVTAPSAPLVRTAPAPLEISETVAEPAATSFKRPRTSALPAEATISPFVRNAIAEREGVSNGAPSMPLPTPVNGVGSHMVASSPEQNNLPLGAKPVTHTATIYAPSVAGLSMMLLPDRGDGPGRCRVISQGQTRVMLESREQHSGAGGYVVVCSTGGKVKWRDFHPKSSAVTALAGVAGKHVAVGTADGMLYLHSATSGRRLLPPVAIDSAPYMLEAICVQADGEIGGGDVAGDEDNMDDDNSNDSEAWFVVVVSRSALVSVFDVKLKKLVCARSAASLLARPFDTEADGKEEAIGAKAHVFREISQCQVTRFGEPILILSDGHAFVYSRDLCSWLRVADDSSPNSEYKRTGGTASNQKRVGLLRSLQCGMRMRNKPMTTLSGMGDLRRAAVESLAHLESLMESAVVLGSASDYRYYLSNYATRISAAVNDDVESCTLRLRELCDSLLVDDEHGNGMRILGMNGRDLLRDTVLPLISENRNMQRIVTEYIETLNHT